VPTTLAKSIDGGSANSQMVQVTTVDTLLAELDLERIDFMKVDTEGFDLKYYSNSKTARFRIALNNYFYGFSNTDVRVETLHAAQQTLLEGAAVWILDNAFGKKVDFSPCFEKPETVALGRDSRALEQGAQVALSADSNADNRVKNEQTSAPRNRASGASASALDQVNHVSDTPARILVSRSAQVGTEPLRDANGNWKLPSKSAGSR